MNKREFMMGSCAALAAGGVVAGESPCAQSSIAAGAGLRRQRLPDLATDMGSHAWRAYLGHRFDAVVGGATVALTLREVSMLDPLQENLEQFSLQFSADGGTSLPAGTRFLAHRTGQRVALYLDPVASDGAAIDAFRADFSLLT